MLNAQSFVRTSLFSKDGVTLIDFTFLSLFSVIVFVKMYKKSDFMAKIQQI